MAQQPQTVSIEWVIDVLASVRVAMLSRPASDAPDLVIVVAPAPQPSSSVLQH